MPAHDPFAEPQGGLEGVGKDDGNGEDGGQFVTVRFTQTYSQTALDGSSAVGLPEPSADAEADSPFLSVSVFIVIFFEITV